MRNVNRVFLPELIVYFWKRVSCGSPCWLWLGTKNQGGYGVITTPDRKKLLAHRFSYLIHHGDTHLHVCHSCDNPGCVNPAHLFSGTQRDNLADMSLKGRRARPWKGIRDERHPRARFTNLEAKLIADRLKGGESGPALAREYGVDHSVIYRTAKRI